jgi:hypothetical protein
MGEKRPCRPTHGSQIMPQHSKDSRWKPQTLNHAMHHALLACRPFHPSVRPPITPPARPQGVSVCLHAYLMPSSTPAALRRFVRLSVCLSITQSVSPSVCLPAPLHALQHTCCVAPATTSIVLNDMASVAARVLALTCTQSSTCVGADLHPEQHPDRSRGSGAGDSHLLRKSLWCRGLSHSIGWQEEKPCVDHRPRAMVGVPAWVSRTTATLCCVL